MKTKLQILQQASYDYFQEGGEMEFKDLQMLQGPWLDAVKNAIDAYAREQSLEFSKYLIENYKCDKIKEGDVENLMPRIYEAFEKERS